jgi:hypothetical protein
VPAAASLGFVARDVNKLLSSEGLRLNWAFSAQMAHWSPDSAQNLPRLWCVVVLFLSADDPRRCRNGIAEERDEALKKELRRYSRRRIALALMRGNRNNKNS